MKNKTSPNQELKKTTLKHTKKDYFYALTLILQMRAPLERVTGYIFSP